MSENKLAKLVTQEKFIVGILNGMLQDMRGRIDIYRREFFDVSDKIKSGIIEEEFSGEIFPVLLKTNKSFEENIVLTYKRFTNNKYYRHKHVDSNRVYRGEKLKLEKPNIKGEFVPNMAGYMPFETLRKVTHGRDWEFERLVGFETSARVWRQQYTKWYLQLRLARREIKSIYKNQGAGS